MSHIGDKVVAIPEGVTVTREGNNVTVKKSKGELTRTFPADIKTNIERNEVTFARPNNSEEMKAIHRTTHADFNNMVIDVNEGFQKALGLIGVGYRAQLQESGFVLSVGYSHSVEVAPLVGITVEVPANAQVTVKSTNKKEAGELVANIRGVHPPESYRGKGIRYADGYVRRKRGKTGK